MSQLQKRYGEDDDEKKNKPKSEIKDDDQAQGAIQKAKKLLEKIEKKAQERKGGRWEICCGIKTWVPD